VLIVGNGFVAAAFVCACELKIVKNIKQIVGKNAFI
jgi:hypothetical protein